MGVGGGFEANEPGGERIVSLAGAALCAGQPLPSSRERLESEPRVGGRLRLPLVPFPTSGSTLFVGSGAGATVAPRTVPRRSIANASLEAICGIHDKKLPRSDLWITFRKTCFVLTAEPGAAFATRDALYIKPEAASNTILLTASAARAMRLIH